MAKHLTVDEIRAGFDQFRKENGRYPTALEIDAYPLLPSSRSLQRTHGGLKQFRTDLGHAITDYGRGAHRSTIAKTIVQRGRNEELELEKLLVGQFGEMFVHIERRFGRKGARVDFFVFSRGGDFGVDVFWADSIHNVRTITSMKMKAYQDYPESVELYLLCANRMIRQKALDSFVRNKKYPLTNNIKLVNPSSFIRMISRKKAYPKPR